jgi:uncharacterized protein (TIGR02391 family)
MVSDANLIDVANIVAGLARRLGLAEKSAFPSGSVPIDIMDLYYNLVKDNELRKHTEKRFINGHYQDAVLEAFKYLNNYIKSRVRKQADGSSLMKEAFSKENPILKLNELLSKSEKDEQLGYMEIFSGVMTGIRNPRAHENDFDNDPFIAIRLLSLADHLLDRAKRAKRARLKKKSLKAAASKL